MSFHRASGLPFTVCFKPVSGISIHYLKVFKDVPFISSPFGESLFLRLVVSTCSYKELATIRLVLCPSPIYDVPRRLFPLFEGTLLPL